MNAAEPIRGDANSTLQKSVFPDEQERVLAGRLGMRLFLASLGVLFSASIIGYAVIRAQLDNWPDLPPLPNALIISTIVLALGSGAIQLAAADARRNEQRKVTTALLGAVLLGGLFLCIQAWCWFVWLEPISNRWNDGDAYRFALTSFYVFTGLHALHVIGGLVPMITTFVQAARGAEVTNRVEYCASYQHFLGVVWLVLYATLLIGA